MRNLTRAGARKSEEEFKRRLEEKDAKEAAKKGYKPVRLSREAQSAYNEAVYALKAKGMSLKDARKEVHNKLRSFATQRSKSKNKFTMSKTPGRDYLRKLAEEK